MRRVQTDKYQNYERLQELFSRATCEEAKIRRATIRKSEKRYLRFRGDCAMDLTEIAITEFEPGILQLQWRRQRDGEGHVDGDDAFCFHLCATCRGCFLNSLCIVVSDNLQACTSLVQAPNKHGVLRRHSSSYIVCDTQAK